jgi:hypothetical protein
MEVPGLTQETVHGNLGLQRFLANSLVYSQNLSTGYIKGNKWYVDGNVAGSGDGKTWEKAVKTVQEAVNLASANDVIFVAPKTPGIWDPVAYAESVIIPYTKPLLSIIGVSPAPVYGAMPLIGVTAGTDPCLTIRAPGCRISGLSFSATGATSGGGICLDDDGSTKAAYGAMSDNCYFYECLGGKLVAAGGAIYWSANGGAWQLRVLNNYFMSNSGGVVLLGTGGSRPTDVLIRGNTFASWVNTQIDCDIYLAGGSGAQGVVIDRNHFATVDGPNATEDHYMNLTGCERLVSNNLFSCKSGSEEPPLSFGATTHTGAKIPAEVRLANNWGEAAVGSKGNAWGGVYRTD